jgi:N-acetylmuramoyl-L-alanine amidase
LRSIVQHKRSGYALLLGALVLAPAVCLCSVSPERQARAIAAYKHAVSMRATLESRPQSKRTKAEYAAVMRVFHEVYRLNPAYSKTPVALAAIAELKEDMGRVFANDRYYFDAIKAYQFVIEQYPYNSVRFDALLAIGEIYRADLKNPEAARQTFQEYLKKYPHTEGAEEAQKKLKEIEELLAARAVSPPAPAATEAGAQHASGLRELTAIRHWVGPNYTRVVIATGGEVKFDTLRLQHPDRIVMDLQNTRLSPDLVGKTFPVENGFLKQVRVGQFTPTVTRVVLDVEKIEDYSVIPLPNPFRFVIDIHGESTTTTAKAETSHPEAKRQAEARAKEAEKKTPAKSQTAAPTQTRPSEPVETAAAETPAPPTKTSTEASAKGETSAEAASPPKPAAPTKAGSRTLTRALGLKIGRIVIDPGHGGHDTGTIGPTGLEEKDLVLDVGLRLRKLLEDKIGCDVIMTRTRDTFIPLEERTAIANEKAADLFISIHANASRHNSARGVETYYLNFTSNPEALEVAARENATSQESVHQLQDLIKKIAMTEKIEESQDFARYVQRDLYRRIIKIGGRQRDRGVKKAPFVVLIGANMPSILAEISFLTNPHDERLLRKSQYRQKIAEALYQGIVDYVNTLGGVKVAQRASEPATSSPVHPEF